MTVRVLVPLAAGAEEMEVVIVVDVLRRAGFDVLLAGIAGAAPVTCSRGVILTPDRALTDALADTRADAPFDATVLPGGAKGAEALAADAELQAHLREQQTHNRVVAAICAAPIALVAAGVGGGKRLTSHPGVRERVATHGAYSEDRVVIDGRLVTSRGPGTAFEFALALIELLAGRAEAEKVAGPMLVHVSG